MSKLEDPERLGLTGRLFSRRQILGFIASTGLISVAGLDALALGPGETPALIIEDLSSPALDAIAIRGEARALSMKFDISSDTTELAGRDLRIPLIVPKGLSSQNTKAKQMDLAEKGDRLISASGSFVHPQFVRIRKSNGSIKGSIKFKYLGETDPDRSIAVRIQAYDSSGKLLGEKEIKTSDGRGQVGEPEVFGDGEIAIPEIMPVNSESFKISDPVRGEIRRVIVTFYEI